MSARLVGLLVFGSLLGCGAGPAPAPPNMRGASSSAPVVVAPLDPPGAMCSATPPSAPVATDVIARVEMLGLARIPGTDACRYLLTRAGQPIDEQRIHEDAKSLFDSGLFEDVTVAETRTANATAIVFSLRERPLVHRFTVHGAQSALSKRIAEALPKVGDVFDPQSLRHGIERVEGDYVADGYRRVKVDFKVHPAPSNEVDVDVTVVEGPLALVQSITVQGAAQARESEIRALINTAQGGFNALGMPYRPDSLERDRHRMTGYYLDRGMVQASVAEEVVTLSADGKSATIVIEIDEGPVYKLRRIRCQGDLAGSEQKCLELLGVKKGRVFARNELQAGLDRIREHQEAKKKGHVVEPEVTVDEQAHAIDLTISITNAP